jgi:addiction module HigA family antidote
MLPKHRSPTHPGEILLEEFLKPLERSQADLARTLNKTTTAVSELIHGKRNVTPEMAWLLANEFKVSPEFWMNLQTTWDLWHAKKSLEKRLGKRLTNLRQHKHDY